MTTLKNRLMDRLPGTPGLYVKPRPVIPLRKFKKQVIHTHKSDMLLQEQVENVENVQEALRAALAEVDEAESQEERDFLLQQVRELKYKSDVLIVMLQILRRINTELMYSRLDLNRELKEGSSDNINRARKRVGWLEDRMEVLLGKKSPQATTISSSPRPPGQGVSGGRSLLTGGRGFSSDVSRSLGESNSEVSPLFRVGQTHPHLPTPYRRSREGLSSSSSQFSPRDALQPGLMGDSPHGALQPGLIGEKTLPTLYPGQSSESLGSETGAGGVEGRGAKVEEKKQEGEEMRGGEAASQTSGSRSPASSGTATPQGYQAADPRPSTVPVLPAKSSSAPVQSSTKQVSLRDMLLTPQGDVNTDEQAVQAAMQFWLGEKNRFEYSQHIDSLLSDNPTSYHNMGLAIPGSFVDETEPLSPGTKKQLRKRPISSLSDVHLQALDRLTLRIHTIYGKVREASLMSVHHHLEDVTDLLHMDALSSAGSDVTSAHVVKAAPSKSLVAVDEDKSVWSVRSVYQPPPLLPLITLPRSKVTQAEIFPPESTKFIEDVAFDLPVHESLVQQGDLYQQTKFTSSLFKARVKSEKENNERTNMVTGMDQEEDEEEEEDNRGGKERSRLSTKMGTNTSLKPGTRASGKRWSQMKPRSGALKHSGLKWERVKDLVHSGLTSPFCETRVDACRHLGSLRCTDTMVLFSLRERLHKDSEQRVVYEAAKALITLGCWEEDSLRVVLQYLLDGNEHIKADLLRTMIMAKNSQYINQDLPCFPLLVETLGQLCISTSGPSDRLSFEAAVCLGRLGVKDQRVKDRLLMIITETDSHHMKAEALDILVRNFRVGTRDVVECLLQQINTSSVWKFRLDALKLLSLLGPKKVFKVEEVAQKVYSTLETKLWDDPNKNVRDEAAKTIAALDVYAAACERAERQLEDQDNDRRAQAVLALGTLRMKTRHIVRQLLEMMELDGSENVRCMVVRTFAALNVTEARVLRLLKDKEKGEGRIARESQKALKVLQVST